MQVQDPPVNIVEMVSKKCEENKRAMLVEVETTWDPTRGELAGAAWLQEAMTIQQTKMSKVEEVITTTASAADQKKTQDMVERMMRIERERKTQLDTGVELEDDPL